MKKLCINKNLDISNLNEVQDYLDKSLEESPFKAERHFNISNLAKKNGHEDDYSFLYKLCSKLMHPSSMKVNASEVLTENSNYLNVIIDLGVYFSNKVETFSVGISEELKFRGQDT